VERIQLKEKEKESRVTVTDGFRFYSSICMFEGWVAVDGRE